MKAAQKRVVEYKEALDKEVQELNEFLAKDMPEGTTDHERQLMLVQADLMGQLSNILSERIATF